MHDEVMAVEEKCDRRIELLTQSVQKSRKRARIQVDRIEDDEEEWVSSVLLHAEQTRVKVGLNTLCFKKNEAQIYKTGYELRACK